MEIFLMSAFWFKSLYLLSSNFFHIIRNGKPEKLSTGFLLLVRKRLAADFKIDDQMISGQDEWPIHVNTDSIRFCLNERYFLVLIYEQLSKDRGLLMNSKDRPKFRFQNTQNCFRFMEFRIHGRAKLTVIDSAHNLGSFPLQPTDFHFKILM